MASNVVNENTQELGNRRASRRFPCHTKTSKQAVGHAESTHCTIHHFPFDAHLASLPSHTKASRRPKFGRRSNNSIVHLQVRSSNIRPQRLMVRHPAFEIPLHGLHGLLVERDVVGVDAEDLRPSLSAGVFKGEVDVREGLANLGLEIPGDGKGVAIPAVWNVGWVSFLLVGVACKKKLLGRLDGRWMPTLAGDVDGLADADGLVVARERVLTSAVFPNVPLIGRLTYKRLFRSFSPTPL